MKTRLFSSFSVGIGFLCLLATLAPRAALAQIGFIPPPGPAVRIVSPADHSVFYAPVDIPLFAFTHPLHLTQMGFEEVEFTNVEFYATNESVKIDLGPGVQLDATTNLPYFLFAGPNRFNQFPAKFHAMWCLVWSNAPQGSFVLTAVARGREPLSPLGTNVVSTPVNLTILASTNGVNATNVVSIVATDPIAIAGTNISWVWPGMTNPVPIWTNWPPPHWGYFTNWGPKPALFTVRRFGDASSNLTVNYKASGTASNGVDYVTLPGYINLPAGAGYGLIPIVPVDNGSNNLIKTVVLTLTPATNIPTYTIGRPPAAEALIYYHWPRPLPLPLATVPPAGGFLADGAFHMNAAGPDGAWFAIQSSADLVNWTSVATNQVVEGAIDFADPDAPNHSSGFYRALPLNTSPAP